METNLFKQLANINYEVDKDLLILDKMELEVKLHFTFKNNRDLGDQLRNLSNEFEERSKEYKSISSNYEGKIERLQEQIRSNEKENDNLKEEMRVIKRNTDNSEKAISSLRSDLKYKPR